jgi:hypothetical protein
MGPLPHRILVVFNTILYENEFQNPQIFQQTIMSVFFPSNQLYLRLYEAYSIPSSQLWADRWVASWNLKGLNNFFTKMSSKSSNFPPASKLFFQVFYFSTQATTKVAKIITYLYVIHYVHITNNSNKSLF